MRTRHEREDLAVKAREMRLGGSTRPMIQRTLGLHCNELTSFLLDRRCDECGILMVSVSYARCKTCADVSKRITRSEAYDAIMRFFVAHGRPPKQLECGSANGHGLPAFATLARLFGSFSEAIQACGLTPRQTGCPRGATHKKPSHRKKKPGVYATREEELSALIAEQKKAMRSYVIFNRQLDGLEYRFKGRFVTTDEWVHAVHHLVDKRREIDQWATTLCA